MVKNMSFCKKLQIIGEIYFEKHTPSFSEDELSPVEKSLQTVLPDALRAFYIQFGGNLDLLKCMHEIADPNELFLDNNILMIAKENQNVCAYGIDLGTQKPVYLDKRNHILQPIDQELEDFLLYLLAIQGAGFFHCVGKISVKNIDVIETHFFRLTKTDGEGAVFCRKSGIIAVAVGNDIFLSAKEDACMELLESESGLEIDYL